MNFGAACPAICGVALFSVQFASEHIESTILSNSVPAVEVSAWGGRNDEQGTGRWYHKKI